MWCVGRYVHILSRIPMVLNPLIYERIKINALYKTEVQVTVNKVNVN